MSATTIVVLIIVGIFVAWIASLGVLFYRYRDLPRWHHMIYIKMNAGVGAAMLVMAVMAVVGVRYG